MTRKSPKREALSLDSPEWVPLATAHADLSKHLDSRIVAGQRLTKEARAKNVRSMVRCVSRDLNGRYPPAYEAKELSVDFWRDHEIDGSWSKVGVGPHPRRGGQPHFLSGVVFYVWGPDLKIFYPSRVASTASNEPMQETPVKRGRKPYPHAEYGAAAYALATSKKPIGAPEKTPPQVVDELRAWLKDHKRKVPSDSVLRDIVYAACRVRTLLKR